MLVCNQQYKYDHALKIKGVGVNRELFLFNVGTVSFLNR